MITASVLKELKIRIAIFGYIRKSFLFDNVGEFNNSEFISFCENFNLNIKMTAAESPWSKWFGRT